MGYTPQITDLLGGCACSIIFILLLSLDAWKAIKRKTYWLPGGFLVLSAFTLQFINYVNYSTVSVSSGTNNVTAEDVEIFLSIQLVIDSGRLVICVFIAYLLPGLVSSGFRSVWGDIGALASSVLAHIFSEIYLIVYVNPYYLDSDYFDSNYNNSVTVWFKVYSAILVIAIILLILLSICAVLAGKSIRIIINKKVPSLLSCCSNSRRDCGNIGDHVLKCWIVVRSSQPEYIMARSVLSSFAGLLVTVCVIFIVVKWRYVFNDDYKTADPLNKTTFLLQFMFASIGWIVVSVRWLTAVKYFPRDGRSLFQVEDFWTRGIIDLESVQLKGWLFWEKRNPNRILLQTKIVDLIIAVRLNTLFLFIGILLQKLIVLSSKASCFLSSILLWPVLKIHEKIMLLSGSNILESEFSKYRKLLEIIRMPGEIAESLWIANESAFKSTKKHMQQGVDSTKDLMEIIKRLQTEPPAADEGEEEKYLKYDDKKSWKMKAVSLIHFMLCSYNDSNSEVVDVAIKACSEAWALMDFVESSHTEVNFLSLAADKEFESLENIWNKHLKNKLTESEPVRTIRSRMTEDLKSRVSDGKSHGSVYNMQDSMDWMMAAANFSLSETSKAIDLQSAHTINDSRCLLASVIVNCLTNELNNALIEKCNKWAVDFEEEEIYDAAFIAGKAMSVSDFF